MIYLLFILGGACAFMGGYIFGATDILNKKHQKEQIKPERFVESQLDEEYQNFLSYDGSEQI
ncbi:MAG: hypothetical protein IJP22_01115 [Clostridia bacterium]|nr:hypothetical protein [Clostridia bacterium]